jgi:diguanylate cyclase (GGDEF)-like protein
VVLAITIIGGYKVKAQDARYSNPDELISELKALAEDTTKTPIEKRLSVAQLKATSVNKQWAYAELLASVLDVELEVSLDNTNEANRKLKPLYEIATSFDDPEVQLRLDMSQIRIDAALGNFKSVEVLRQRLLNDVDEIDKPSIRGGVFVAVAESQYMIAEYADAIQNYRLAYQAYAETNNDSDKAFVKLALGNVNTDIGNPTKAMEYFSEALKATNAAGDLFLKSVVLYNIGNTHFQQGEYELTINSLSLAKSISQDINDEIGVAWAIKRQADAHKELGQWQLAIDGYSQVEELFSETGSLLNQFDIHVGLAASYLGHGKFEKALDSLRKSEPFLDKLKQASDRDEYFLTLADIHATKGDYKNAFEVISKNYDSLKNAFYLDRQRDIEKYRIQFDSELTDEQNQILLSENQLKNLEIQTKQEQAQTLAIISILVLLLLLVVGFLLFKQVKNRDLFKALALKDYLTGSPNRRAVLDSLSLRFEQAKYGNAELIVGLIDFDNFKQLNDKYGHAAGDKALQAFSDTCSKVLRKQDSFGRYGGEEWLIVFDDIEFAKVFDVFERLRQYLNENDIEGVPSTYKFTFSMGLAKYDASLDDNMESLIKRADQSLYLAKSEGRDRVVEWSEST